MTAPTVSAALASQALEQHIGWIRIYAEDMTGGNWRDMALRIKRQVNELEETVKAEVLRLGEENEKLQKLAQEGDGARMQRDALSRVIDDKDAIIAEAESRALQAVAAQAAMFEALDEIAYGAPWGGPAEDHITFMRKTADKAISLMAERAKQLLAIEAAARKLINGRGGEFLLEQDLDVGRYADPDARELEAALTTQPVDEENRR